jgi:hypothetical protein
MQVNTLIHFRGTQKRTRKIVCRYASELNIYERGMRLRPISDLVFFLCLGFAADNTNQYLAFKQIASSAVEPGIPGNLQVSSVP